MPDDRSLEEKLTAMASQSASPAEAAIAKVMLRRLHGSEGQRRQSRPTATARGKKTRPVVSRDAVFDAPDEVSRRARVKVLWPGGTVFTMLEDEADWELIETYGMPWRYADETKWRHTQATPNARKRLQP